MLSSSFSPYSSTLNSAQQLRQPRAIVVINGFYVLWVDIRIVTTTFYVADSYSVEIPLYGQPDGFDIQYLSTLGNVTIKIYIGFPKNPDAFTTSDLDLLMSGDCDEMTINPLSASVNFSGRDLTSRFIDVKTYAKYANQTASSIVSQLAESHGIGTSLITQTQGSVGQFYTRQNTLMSKETTQWDLITFLAQQYNFVTYIQQNNQQSNLYFGPKPSIENTKPYVLSYQQPNSINASPIFNGMALNMTRCFTVAKDVTVKVRVPYSPQSGRAFTASAGKSNPTINSNNASAQIYTYTYPGLTNSQALATAQTLLAQITLNEIKISCMLPGENTLGKSSLIRILGTNSRFDQYYYTDTITRTININDGYWMEVNAKNQDVNSQVTL